MSQPPPRPESVAHRIPFAACLSANLALPGSGTLQAGHRIGWAQMALAVLGLLLTSVFFVWLIREWAATRQFPMIAFLDRGEFPPGGLKCLRIGLGGMALFISAFVWGILSALIIYRGGARSSEAKKP